MDVKGNEFDHIDVFADDAIQRAMFVILMEIPNGFRTGGPDKTGYIVTYDDIHGMATKIINDLKKSRATPPSDT